MSHPKTKLGIINMNLNRNPDIAAFLANDMYNVLGGDYQSLIQKG